MGRLGKRLVIELTHQDYEYLVQAAAAERRAPGDQAAIFVEQAVRPQPELDAQPSPSPDAVDADR